MDCVETIEVPVPAFSPSSSLALPNDKDSVSEESSASKRCAVSICCDVGGALPLDAVEIECVGEAVDGVRLDSDCRCELKGEKCSDVIQRKRSGHTLSPLLQVAGYL